MKFGHIVVHVGSIFTLVANTTSAADSSETNTDTLPLNQVSSSNRDFGTAEDEHSRHLSDRSASLVAQGHDATPSDLQGRQKCHQSCLHICDAHYAELDDLSSEQREDLCKRCACDCFVKASNPIKTQCEEIMITSNPECVFEGYKNKILGNVSCAYRGGLYMKGEYTTKCHLVPTTVDHCGYAPSSSRSTEPKPLKRKEKAEVPKEL